MPELKPDASRPYLAPQYKPINAEARAKRDAEVKANLYAILKLLAFAVIAGILLALRK